MRELEKEMIDYLDDKLAKNGMAQQAIKDKNARYVFICAVEACVGIREKGGNNDGPMVRLLQKTIGGASREPWCMSFIQTCLGYAEIKTGVKSPIHASEHCMTVLRNTPKSQLVKVTPLKGAIVIWNYDGTDKGHTGMIVEATLNSHFVSIEGNTGDDGGRDGDGVYIKQRNWIRNGSLRRKEFLKPF